MRWGFHKPGIKNVNARVFFYSLKDGVLMNSYVVRIYRRTNNNPRLLVGVVEEPGAKGKNAFHNLYELWDILNTKKEKQTKQRKTEGNGKGRKNRNP